jgi:hypothetical protein
MSTLETTRRLHLATKPGWRRSFNSIFYRDNEDVKFGAILVQVENCLQASGANDVGRKLFASYVFKHWKTHN